MVSSAASPQASGSCGTAVAIDAGQPDRVGGQVAVLGGAGRGDEPLVEHHVDDGEHVVEPGRELVRRRDRQRDAGLDDLALGPDDPLGERALVDQERAGDLRRGEADHRAEGERQPGLGRQSRVAAGEEQGQPVVGAGPRVGRRAARPGPRATAAASSGVRRRARCAGRPPAARRPGLRGGPSRRQPVSASTTADCTASSARSKSPNRRESRATSGPASSRRVRARRLSVERRSVTRTGSSPRPSAGSRPSSRGTSGWARSW